MSLLGGMGRHPVANSLKPRPISFETQAFPLFLSAYPAQEYHSLGPCSCSNPSDLSSNPLQLFTTTTQHRTFSLSTPQFLKSHTYKRRSNVTTMPPKLEPDESMKFLYTCFKSSDFTTVRIVIKFSSFNPQPSD